MEKKVLIPTMFNFVQTNIEDFTKKDFISNICAFYNKLLQESFALIGKTTAR